MRPVEIVEGVELVRGFVGAAELRESHDLVGEVGEMLVRLGEEEEGSGLRYFVEDRFPRAAGGELVEGAEIVCEFVEGIESFRWWIGDGCEIWCG